MKKLLAIVLVLMLGLLPLAACGTPASSTPPASTPQASTPAPAESTPAESTPADTGGDKIGTGLKAAMILPGPISDPGFNGPAYDGLVRMQDELGYEISFAESVAASDYENVFRTYAQQGYDIIFAHGNQFLETAMLVAEDFPDTWFAVSSAFGSNEKNVSGWNLSSYDVGFLVGALMGQLTEAGKLGMVSGAEIPPIVMIYDGMRAGAAYIDPAIEVQTVYGLEETAQSKEAAIALLDAGCDLLSSTSGVGSPGVIAACDEADLYYVGTSIDWSTVDPDTVLTSVVTDWGGAAFASAELFAKGELQPRPYTNGVAEGAVYMVNSASYDTVVPADVRARMDEIVADVVAGNINITELVGALG